MKISLKLLPLCGLLALAACSRPKQPEEGSSSPALAMPQAAAPAAAPASPALLSPEKLSEKAPDLYKARFKTTKGDFVIEVHRDWAPNGADRFYNLVKNGFYDDTAFFRAVPGFMVQFGITGNPDVNARWRQAAIPDDPVKQSNKPGMVTFATAGPNTRTTQVFINFNDNASLDSQGFAPFGTVTSGLDVVNKLYSGYGDGPPMGHGPDQSQLQLSGNAYLKRDFSQLDYTTKAAIED